jgi:hypothetical protein
MSSSEPPQLDAENPNTQQVLPGVAFKWVEGNRIIICRLRDNKRLAVDVFNLTFASILRDRNKELPFAVMFDLSKLDLGLTGYFKDKFTQMMTEHATIEGRAAWLVREDHFARSTELFVTRSLPVYNPKFARRVFHEHDAALDWLKEGLEPEQTSEEESSE